MKKLNKLFTLLLAFLMVLSLFTACGGSDKAEKETALTGSNLLIGDWEAAYREENNPISLLFTFKPDGSAQTTLAESCYDDIINQMTEAEMSAITDEDIAAEGFSSREEAEKFVKETLIKEYTYEAMATEYQFSGTWKLNGDTLTLTVEGGGTLTAETKLSAGQTTFICNEMEFTKIR